MEQTTRLIMRSMGRWLMTLLLVMLSSLATKAQLEVHMGDVQGAPGETVHIPIYVGCGMDIRAFEMHFSTDLGIYFSDGEFSDWLAPSAYSILNSDTGLIMAIDLYSIDNATLEAGEGLLAEVYLDIPDNAQPGAHTMTLSGIQFIPTGSGAGGSIYLNDITATLTVAGGDPEAYACYTPSNTTLTFYYDTQRSSRPGTTYDLNTGGNDTDWDTDGTRNYVTKVVFDPSFANARPTTTCDWFYDMTNLQSITGMEYLNTSEVTNMNYMFLNCIKLTSLDVSHFNTSKVIKMTQTFAMCTRLTSLDLSNFNTSKVTDMNSMFYYCYNLRTIYVGDGWSTAAVTYSTFMFDGNSSLVGGQGTTYDDNHVDKTYAHIDGGPSNPGYFTAKNANKRGDVDGNSNVNMDDLTALINYLLNNDSTGINMANAASCDNPSSTVVNMDDLTALINYLLTNTWP